MNHTREAQLTTVAQQLGFPLDDIRELTKIYAEIIARASE